MEIVSCLCSFPSPTIPFNNVVIDVFIFCCVSGMIFSSTSAILYMLDKLVLKLPNNEGTIALKASICAPWGFILALCALVTSFCIAVTELFNVVIVSFFILSAASLSAFVFASVASLSAFVFASAVSLSAFVFASAASWSAFVFASATSLTAFDFASSIFVTLSIFVFIVAISSAYVVAFGLNLGFVISLLLIGVIWFKYLLACSIFIVTFCFVASFTGVPELTVSLKPSSCLVAYSIYLLITSLKADRVAVTSVWFDTFLA